MIFSPFPYFELILENLQKLGKWISIVLDQF